MFVIRLLLSFYVLASGGFLAAQLIEEDCCDGKDDDGDELIDFDDPDCAAAVCPCLREPFELYFSDGQGLFDLGLPVHDGDLVLEEQTFFMIASRNSVPLEAFQFGVRFESEGELLAYTFSGDLTTAVGEPLEVLFTDSQGNNLKPRLPNRLLSERHAVGVERGSTLEGLAGNDLLLLEWTDGPAGNGFLVGYVADLAGEQSFVPPSEDFDLCLGNELIVVHLEHGDFFFERGDPNADGARNITDAILVLFFLFDDGPEPPCLESGDVNDDGTLDISDAIYLLSFLFVGGPAPRDPFQECGADATPDDLTCETSPACG